MKITSYLCKLAQLMTSGEKNNWNYQDKIEKTAGELNLLNKHMREVTN